MLAFAGGNYVTRAELTAYLWPDELDSVSNNRLRVTLSRFRESLPGLMLESNGLIAMNRNGSSCDVWELEDLMILLEESVSQESLLSYQIEIARSVNAASLIEWGSPASGLMAQIVSVCRQGLRVSFELGDWNAHRELAFVGLSFLDSDAEFCLAALESGIHLGDGQEIVREVRKSVTPAVLGNPSVSEMMARIRAGDSAVSEMQGATSQFLLKVMETVIDKRPELVRALLATPETLSLAGEQPREMLKLLESVIVNCEERDHNWEFCVARATGLRAWLNDSAGTLELGYELVECSQNPKILRATWNAISIAHSLARDWDQAFLALDKTLEFAKEAGDDVGYFSTNGNGASYLMHQGRYNQATLQYDECLRGLLALGTPHAQFDYAVGLGNSAFVPLFAGDWNLAKEKLELAIALRSDESMPIQLGLLKSGLGCVEAQLGNREVVFSLIRSGFIDAFRSQSERNIQITFEFASAALAFAGDKGFAMAVFEWVDRWRERSRMPRSVAERDFCERTLDGFAEPIDSLSDTMDVREAGQMLMRKLRLILS